MKIAIFSDTHDNIPNTLRAVEYLKKNNILAMIHCGDIANTETIETIAKNFLGSQYYVCGNCDRFSELSEAARNHKHIKIFEVFGEVKIGNKNIAWAHHPKDARGLALTGEYDIVFYGHTHIPWEEIVRGARMVNPGTLAGMFSKPTFALYDTVSGANELILLEKI